MAADFPVLYDWYAKAVGGPYTPPEMCGLCVKGTVAGSPRFPDGDRIQTAPVVAVDGTLITTASGSTYRLGAVREAYLQWLTDNDIPFDPEHPIRMKPPVGEEE